MITNDGLGFQLGMERETTRDCFGAVEVVSRLQRCGLGEIPDLAGVFFADLIGVLVVVLVGVLVGLPLDLMGALRAGLLVLRAVLIGALGTVLVAALDGAFFATLVVFLRISMAVVASGILLDGSENGD